MNLLKYLLSLAMAIAVVATTQAYGDDEQDGSRFEEELNERDFDALRDYLRSKRAVDIVESVSELTISGDVRTEYRHLNETCRGVRLRGHDATDLAGRPISRNDFDIEFNLRFDYICDKAWATAHVRFDNSAGVDDNGHPCGPKGDDFCSDCCKGQAKHCVGDPRGFHGSGHCDDICLKKAYMGYELYSDCDSRFFVELGRRGNLYNVFDSNIQFLSRFDGLLLKYERTWDCVADWYIQGAGFLIDERVNQFAWVVETGVLNIADSGFDFKYSLIDWEKHGRNRCRVRNPAGFRFINSQWTGIYHFERCGMPVKAYAAFLINHAAKKLKLCTRERRVFNPETQQEELVEITREKRGNLGWYAGILFGEVRKEGDWALEIQYQYVGPQAIPDDDVAGICRGNVLDESFTTCSRRGNTNYKGWRFEGLYAFTDNLTLDTIIEWSKAADPSFGGKHTYSKTELEAIYAF